MLLYLRVLDQRRLSWTKIMPSTQAIIFVPSGKVTLRSSSTQVILEVTRQLFRDPDSSLDGRLARALRARAGMLLLINQPDFPPRV
jgi:hypothetical protein